MIIREYQLEPAPRRSSPSGKHVHIGLDYGTCSTKVIIRPRGDRLGQVLLLDENPTQDYPLFATPSAVRVCQDRIFFGGRAVSERGGTFLKSLKGQLLPHDPELEQKPLALPPGTDLEFLIACYLGWALGEIRQRIGDRTEEDVTLNVAAPMSYIVDKSLKEQYLRIVQAAWESVFGQEPFNVTQGGDLKTLREYFAMWLERDPPGLKVRKYDVLPETIAPFVSLSLNPRTEPGMYLIVDMGAGTTEFSVDQVTDPGIDQKLNCYFDRSIRIGGDDLQIVDGQAIVERIKNLVLEKFGRSFGETWYSGSLKDCVPAARSKWRSLRVMLTGGGARHPSIRKRIDESWPKSCFGVATESYSISWHQPISLDLSALSDRIPEADLPLLSVAHGLSIERHLWPASHNPDDIEKLQPLIEYTSPAEHSHLEN